MSDLGIVVGEKVAENLVDRILNFILNPITVVRKCSENVENLKNQLEKLEGEKMRVENYTKNVRRRGEVVDATVRIWVTRAQEFIEAAEKAVRDGDEFAKKECFFRLCPNPIPRYKLSKKAEKNSQVIVDHLKEAPGFGTHQLSYAPSLQQDVDEFVEDFEVFSSRKIVLSQIMKALRSPTVSTIGVYGTSGMGKTMLVKMVKGKAAQQDKLFTAVVMATVTENPDLTKIQYDIACDLGMDQLPTDLRPEEVANRIKRKLIEKKNFLVILDDVWGTGTDILKQIGIPSASELKKAMEKENEKQATEKRNEESSSGQQDMLRKILLTSRYRDVLSEMMEVKDEDQVFWVDKLEVDEAWHLFKKTVGSEVERSNFQPIARQIVDTCLGLPVAIVSVGNAMKRKNQQFEWEDALQQMKKPSPTGIAAEVYKAVKLNYNNLEERVKPTFILCSLLGHDFSVDDLLKCGMGLDLFQMLNTIEDTRTRVRVLVSRLKQSALLVDGHSTLQFGVHDQIREVALSIAFEEHGGFALVDEAARKKLIAMGSLEKLRWISLPNGDIELPANVLQCPQLTFFYLSNKAQSLEVPSEFLKRADALKVLCLTKIDFQSMPSQVSQIPAKLHTLLLEQCVFRVEELGAILGSLECLEVLSLAGCVIEELPRELEKLSKLKLLDVSDCTKLKVIPPKVLEGLSKLEELKMGNSFNQWDDAEERNAKLAELSKLSELTALEVCIANFRANFFPEKLKRFKIFIGDVSYSSDSSFESSKIMKLELQDASISSSHSVIELLKKTEELYLKGLNGVENFANELDDGGFQDLKFLEVENAPDIQHIFNPAAGRLVRPDVFPILEVLALRNLEKMEKICHGLTGAASFKELRKITVVGCHQLKNLFSYSMARQLQLEKIKVEDCNNIEQIIDDVEEQGSRNDIVEESEGCKLGNTLRSLKLKELPKLIGFNSNCSDISLFNDKVIFPNLEELHLSEININQLWIIPSFVEHSQEIHNFKKLKSLRISNFSRLEYLFTFPMVSCLEQLEDLDVSHCEDLKQVMMVRVEEVVNTELIFPRLNSISLWACDKLSSFHAGSDGLKLESTTKISIYSCPNMITFASTFSTEQEKEAAYQEIEGRSGQKESDIPNRTFFYASVEIPLLDNLCLSGVCARQIWHSEITSISSFVQNLRKLTFWCCDNLKYLFTSSMVKSFGQLEVLQIWGCEKMLMVILMEELAEKETMMFPKLDTLELDNVLQLKRFCSNYNSLGEEYEPQRLNGSGSEVPAATQSILVKTKVTLVFPRVTYLKLRRLNLKSFFPQFYITRWPLLKRMHVEQCDKMKTFASEFPSIEITYGDNQLERQTQHPMFWIIKESFPCLEELKFEQNDSMKEIWHGQYPGLGTLEVPSIVPFKNLQDLEISRCDGLENLLSYSTAKSLVQLKRMSITNCDLVEEIVWCLEVEVKDGIVFNQLKYLKLCGLPKLGSFCAAKCDFEFLSLNEVIVIKCPRMKYFSMGKTVTKELQTVQWINDEEKQGHWVGNDLNSTIKDLFIQKVSYLESGNLWLSKFPELIEIWKKNPEELSSLFQNLRHLKVCNCNNLSYLLTPTRKLAFVQLEGLEIKDCAAMEQVIMVTGVEEVVETGLTFPRLKSILLESCSKLSSFYVGSNALRFPLLEKITINNCQKMVRFTSKISSIQEKGTIDGKSEEMLVKEEPDIFIGPFFCDEIVFPNLETLQLSGIKINQLWTTSSCVENPQEILNFKGLKRLQVWHCSSLEYLFTPSMVSGLVQLQVLTVSYCKDLKQVIMAEGVEEAVNRELIFPQLQFIWLGNCKKLSSFYAGSGSCALKFQSDIKFSISDCPNMITFVSTFSTEKEKETAYQKTDQGHLQKNEPNICSQTLFDDMVVIPVLNDLYLSSIRVQIVFLNLEELQLSCIKINQLWTTSSCVENPQEIWNFKGLKRLQVSHCSSLEYLFTPSMVSGLGQLKELSVSFCKDLKQVIIAEGVEEAVNRELIFPQLNFISLLECNELSSFYAGSGSCALKFQSDIKFSISDCPNMITFVSTFSTEKEKEKETAYQKTDQGHLQKNEPNICSQTLFDDMVVIPVLDDLFLKSICVQQIWPNQITPMSSFVQKLRKLTLWYCNNLKYLFTSLMVKIFEQLEELQIKYCKKMQVVILIEEPIEKERTSQTIFPKPDSTERHDFAKSGNTDVKYGIKFSQLKSLELNNLPKLSSYSTGKCDLEFPSLKEVIVTGCPQMKYFSMGKTVAKELQNVQLTHYEKKGHWVGDLNSTIQDLHTQKVGCLERGNLWLSKFPELIEIWKMNPEKLSLLSENLQRLNVCNCNNLSYLLTPNMALAFVQLEDLEIKDCAAMEQVIMVTGFEEVVETGLTFPRLKEITVKNCPKMVRFTSKFLTIQEKETTDGKSEEMLVKEEPDIFIGPFFCDMIKIPFWKTLTLSSINIRQIWNSQLSSISPFAQHLTKLKVVNCCNLKYLLTSSMVKSFAQLKKLMISECEIMEVVILIEGMAEEERIYRSMFPQLKTLVLNDLPQLATFCSNCDSLGEISEPERVNFGIGSQELVATESTSMETEATKVVFSQVTWLALRLLPKFKYFFPQTHITEWPSLERLVVMECHEVQIVASEFSSIEMTLGDNQLERESQHLMFWISKATFPSLKHLAVSWNDNLKIWCGHHPEEYFGFEVLTLIGFPKQSAFPPPFFFDSLPNLKQLVVKDAFLSEIFQCEEVTAKEKPVYGHTSLSKLTLSKLHELTHLWKEESQLEADILNNLRSLKVQECSRLKNLVPSTVHFDNLQTLVVSECHGLVNLMRYSTAKSLEQLQRMKVANCEMIEEIVICLGDAVKDDGIVFTNLEYLQLKGLQRLESFCSGNCNFKFPTLEEAIVTECPNMQIFSKGELSTPYLRQVKLTGDIYEDMDEDMEKKIHDIFHKDEDVEDDEVEDKSCWQGDLNSTIHHFFKEKGAHNSKKSNGHNSDHEAKEDESLIKILKKALGKYFEKDILIVLKMGELDYEVLMMQSQ